MILLRLASLLLSDRAQALLCGVGLVCICLAAVVTVAWFFNVIP